MGTASDEATVYVVDDDPATLRSLTALVRAVFPNVEGYRTANEFLEAFDPQRPGCLVLDVAMPGINGLELHQILKRRQIDLPVVFITAHANVQMAVGAMRAGAVDFLEKPFHEQQLWESIRRALEVDRQQRRRKARRENVERRLAQLSPGERDVLELMLEGKVNREIAGCLQLSVRTVEDRRSRIMKKMGARSIAELVQLTLMH